jgi:5'-3' exonuclease
MIALIDADSLLYIHMNNENSTKCGESLEKHINDIIEKVKADDYYLFLTGNKVFRYDIWPNYKANRKKRVINPLMLYLKGCLLNHPNMIKYDKLEADDTVTYFKNKLGKESIICAIDKDVLYQNEGIHYNYKTGEFITVTKEETETFLAKQLLMGDSGDNIQGLASIGEVRANKLLLSNDNTETTNLTMVFNEYIRILGFPEGVFTFNQNLKLLYILKTDNDMIREVGFLPQLNTNDE